MSTIRHSIIVDLLGNLGNKSRNFTRALGAMSTRGQNSLRALKRTADLTGRGLDRLGNRYVALGTGAAGAGAIRYLVSLETRMTRLGVQSGQSAEKMDALKKRIFEVSRAPDIRVDPGEITSAIEKIVEKTGDLKLAEDNIRNIGLVIAASGAEGQYVGAMIADAHEKFGIDGAEQFLRSLDTMVSQGKEGAFVLKYFATQGERVTSAYAQMNRTGPQAYKEMGAVLQMVKRGVGAPEQAATAFEALIRSMNDVRVRKALAVQGITLVDPEDPKRLRSIVDIVKDVVLAAKGDAFKLGTIFDTEAVRGLNGIMAEYNQDGNFASLDNFMAVSGDGSQLAADAARNAGTAGAALTSLLSGLKELADDRLTGPIKSMADALNGLNAEEIDDIMNKLVWAAGAVGGLVVASKAIRTMAAARTLFGGRRGGVAGALAGAAGGAQPVMVVNWPAGMGMGGGAGGTTKRTGKLAGNRTGRGRGFLRAAGRGARMLGRLGGGIALPIMALSYGSEIVGAHATGDITGRNQAVGGLAGGLAGAATGALVGSVVPVVGTAIGAIIGGLLGSLGGEALGRAVSDGDTRNTVDMTLRIDSEGNPHIDVLQTSGNTVNMDVDAGMVMP